MSWITILTALTLTLTTAILVVIYGWELWMAFGVVVAFSMGPILLLLAVLMWLSPAADRAGIWQGFKVAFRTELAALLKSLRFK